jgi:hypothetical protein
MDSATPRRRVASVTIRPKGLRASIQLADQLFWLRAFHRAEFLDASDGNLRHIQISFLVYAELVHSPAPRARHLGILTSTKTFHLGPT